nr:protein NRT1/ PTR FAMILY 8.2-like [Coffea arabica]XP_027063554.1 protein NRT1/ PTR FAMILY 8.2-like [Coffea arabica]
MSAKTVVVCSLGSSPIPQKKYSFFNWFFFAINMGALLGITLLVYVQVKKGWSWGCAVPTVAMFCSIVILVADFSKYRYQKPIGSAFTRFIQVIVASVRNHFKGVKFEQGVRLYEVPTENSDIFGARKLLHTEQYREEQTFPPRSPPGKLPPKPPLPAPAINRYVVSEPFLVSKMADSGRQGGRGSRVGSPTQ